MRPYKIGTADRRDLERAMIAYRKANPRDPHARDPVVTHQECYCRLCQHIFGRWRGAMPEHVRDARARHVCWASGPLSQLRADIKMERDLGPSEDAEVLLDRYEELTGRRDDAFDSVCSYPWPHAPCQAPIELYEIIDRDAEDLSTLEQAWLCQTAVRFARTASRDCPSTAWLADRSERLVFRRHRRNR